MGELGGTREGSDEGDVMTAALADRHMGGTHQGLSKKTVYNTKVIWHKAEQVNWFDIDIYVSKALFV